MKLTDLAIVFVVCVAAICLVVFIRVDSTTCLLEEQERVDTALNMAIDSAASALVGHDDSRGIYTDRVQAFNNFCSSLYTSFGILSNSSKQEMMQIYIPVFVVADVDGLYVNYKQIADGSVIQMWSERLPYYYTSGSWTVSFRLDDKVAIVNNTSGVSYFGPRKSVMSAMSSAGYAVPSFLSDLEQFESARDYAVTTWIESILAYYTTEHNKAAAKYGITYEFTFSAGESSVWNRSIDDVSLFVVFQGYPLSQLGEYYNKVAMSAARVHEFSHYWCSTDPTTHKKYYHKYLNNSDFECSSRTGQFAPDSLKFDTKEECAQNGYYACPICNP